MQPPVAPRDTNAQTLVAVQPWHTLRNLSQGTLMKQRLAVHTLSWCGGCWCGGCWCSWRRSAHTLAPESVAVQARHTLRDLSWGTGIPLALAVHRRVLTLEVDTGRAPAKALVFDFDWALQTHFAL